MHLSTIHTSQHLLLLLFFLLIPPPPRSTLFPYTTLFRSVRSFQVPATPGTLAWPPSLPSVPTSRATRVTSKASSDRKSTRLNSSHGYISYAVFCLKKKKKNNKLPHQSTTHYDSCTQESST